MGYNLPSPQKTSTRCWAKLKKLSLSLIILTFFSLFLYPAKIASFNDSFKTPAVLVGTNKIYIWDQALRLIRVYSKTNFKKEAEFGKFGGGPAEFLSINRITIGPDFICVSAFPKVCFFSNSGKLIKEIKGTGTDAGSFIPLGSNFVGVSYLFSKPTDEKASQVFSLFDSKLAKKKDIYKAEFTKFSRWGGSKESILWIRDCVKAVVDKDKLIIGSTDRGFYFGVFSASGDKICEIDRKYERKKITNDDKNRIITQFKNRIGEIEWKKYKTMYDMAFPVFFPAFSNFAADNGKLYVFLFPDENRNEYLVLDLKGNLLKKQLLSPKIDFSLVEKGSFSVQGGKLYYLVENEETESVDLFSEAIE